MKKHDRMTRWMLRVPGRRCIQRCHAGGCRRACPLRAMANYTNYPIFLSQTVPPNILFLVDMGNFTPCKPPIAARTSRYPISFKAGNGHVGALCTRNVTVDSQTGDDLVAVDNSGVAINTSNEASPADTF